MWSYTLSLDVLRAVVIIQWLLWHFNASHHLLMGECCFGILDLCHGRAESALSRCHRFSEFWSVVLLDNLKALLIVTEHSGLVIGVQISTELDYVLRSRWVHWDVFLFRSRAETEIFSRAYQPVLFIYKCLIEVAVIVVLINVDFFCNEGALHNVLSLRRLSFLEVDRRFAWTRFYRMISRLFLLIYIGQIRFAHFNFFQGSIFVETLVLGNVMEVLARGYRATEPTHQLRLEVCRRLAILLLHHCFLLLACERETELSCR